MNLNEKFKIIVKGINNDIEKNDSIENNKNKKRQKPFNSEEDILDIIFIDLEEVFGSDKINFENQFHLKYLFKILLNIIENLKITFFQLILKLMIKLKKQFTKNIHYKLKITTE